MMKLLFLLLSLIGFNVHAASFEAATEQVKAQLIASVNAVHAGDEILIGVNQRIIPHWHTYWKNPGDSGLPTKIEYDLPVGSSAGEIQWATPHLIRLGPVVNFGYDNEVTLLSSLKISKDAVVGSQFSIKAKVNWLVCEEACIPQEVELVLELPVIDLNTDTGRGSLLIEQARANLPIPSPWKITLKQNSDFLTLRIVGDELKSPSIQNIAFYPEEWGRITHNAEQPRNIVDDSVELQLKSGDSPITVGNALKGILAITENNGDISTRGYIVDVVLDEVVPNATTEQSDLVLSSAMLLALLGGIILNLMPCVFPVLSIKALSLLKHAQQSPTQTKLQGLAYTAGILVSFILLGVLLILLKAGGAQIGWGFQFQSPLFVLIVAYLMFAVGLSLSGVFSIGGSIMGVGSSLTQKSGYSGSFFTGVLATIVATPCTAPFMGAALGFALSQPPFALLAVFISLGFGLALPYLLLSYSPSLQRYLPKPGVWMDRLKQAMAFPMYAAAVWLVWVLVQQAGVNSVVIALGGMVLISLAGWLYETTKFSGIFTQRISTGFAIFALITALIGGYFGIETSAAVTVENSETTAAKNYEPYYSAERLRTLRAEGKPVFVNFTAAWCISCLVNEKVALSQSSVKDEFKKRGITYLKGDWTNRDAEITKILSEFGRSGVPLYLYYPAGINTPPDILPQILTPEIVLQTVTAKEVSML